MKHLQRLVRSVLVFFFIPLVLFPSSLTKRYPSYSYVLSEFDIGRDFIYNEDFAHFVAANEKRMMRFYKRALAREEGLVNMVRSELLRDGLSDLFLYLSMVESGLVQDALSSKKAAGLWQFMPRTAKYYKLEVCNGVDERCDPFSSTKAAIAHLHRLHEKFGKWYLAIMAYNCGEGRMAKALEKARTDDLEILLDPYAAYLPRETREYMKKILLVAIIGENEMIDFATEAGAKGLVQVSVNAGTDLEKLAREIGMLPRKLKSLNRQFKGGVVPRGMTTCEITIPEERMAAFYLREQPETNAPQIKPHLLSHAVKLGETIEGIAGKYGSTPEEIMEVNHLEGEALELGTVLLIPISQEMFERLLSE
jgi:membrane-bound lytic murein transglycosylase D